MQEERNTKQNKTKAKYKEKTARAVSRYRETYQAEVMQKTKIKQWRKGMCNWSINPSLTCIYLENILFTTSTSCALSIGFPRRTSNSSVNSLLSRSSSSSRSTRVKSWVQKYLMISALDWKQNFMWRRPKQLIEDSEERDNTSICFFVDVRFIVAQSKSEQWCTIHTNMSSLRFVCEDPSNHTGRFKSFSCFSFRSFFVCKDRALNFIESLS